MEETVEASIYIPVIRLNRVVMAVIYSCMVVPDWDQVLLAGM